MTCRDCQTPLPSAPPKRGAQRIYCPACKRERARVRAVQNIRRRRGQDPLAPITTHGGSRYRALAVQTWTARQGQQEARRATNGTSGVSWWLNAPRASWSARCASEAPRMEASREARWVSAYRVEVAGKAETL